MSVAPPLWAAGRSVSRMRETTTEERAKLLALLRARPDGRTWSELAAEVALAGSAAEVWSDVTRGDSLLPDPRLVALSEAAHNDVVEWERRGLRMVTVLDAGYPQRLLEIRETPPFLFVQGSLRSVDPGVSVVGSRDATQRGLSIAAEAARLLVDRGLAVIGGLAAGIDSAAHRTALDLGGRTVAFIGTGITKHYPAANRSLQEAIARDGLVLSQFLPDAPPTKHTFPMRNATMSGYGLATIVVEAGETSGTRIQARVAVQHGRPVILTDDVASKTSWGAALRDRPGVFVVSGIHELASAIDQVTARPQLFEDAVGLALQELASAT